MIDVYVCEDDEKQLATLKQYINDYIMIEAAPMQLKLATSNPYKLLENVDNQHKRLYFLDIALGSDINGLELAQRIRQIDSNCKLVFITTHTEMMFLVFKYQLEVLDYIIKDEPDAFHQRVAQVLALALVRFEQSKIASADYVQFKMDSQARQVQVSDILYIESSPVQHKLVVHLENGTFEYYGTIKDAESLHADLYRCHKSYVVNCKKISIVNKRDRKIELNNGESIICSIKAARELARML